jgi:hypothetical protein
VREQQRRSNRPLRASRSSGRLACAA